MKVKDCEIKDYVTALKNENIFDVAKKLGYNKSIIVLDENNKPVGIITAMDLVRRVLVAGKDPGKTLAEEVMTSPVVTAKLDDDVRKVVDVMLKNDFLTLPVVDGNDKFTGVISVYDVVSVLKKNE